MRATHELAHRNDLDLTTIKLIAVATIALVN